MQREFEYIAPGTLKKILAALRDGGSGAALLAGGTDILVEMRSGMKKPDLLVDIKKARELQGIAWEKGRGLVIGATATMRDLIDSPDARKRYPFLINAALQVGSPQLRNRATVVGNLCTASPCTDMGRALLCIGAEIVIARDSEPGIRIVPAMDFFTGVKRTCLVPGEIVTAVVAPAWTANARGGHEKLKRIKGHDIAVVSVSLVILEERPASVSGIDEAARAAAGFGGIIRIAVGSCARTPVVIEVPAETPIVEILAVVDRAISPIDDIRASAEYRRFMVGTYAERLLARHAALRRRGRPRLADSV